MFFVLSKVVGFFAAASNVVLTLGLIGILLTLTRFARAGRRIAMASLVLIGIMGLSPLGNALILGLEERFPAWYETRGAPAGVIVLGGSFDTVVSLTRNEIGLNEAGERLMAGVVLARKYPDARIVFSGGSGRLVYEEMLESELAARFFESFGIPRERLLLEDKSRNTVENARFTRDLAQAKPGERWLLVTSAYHMPRSVGVFRAVGFEVEAYPVDFRTRGSADLWRAFYTVGDGLRRTDTAAREWTGLVMYWAVGHTNELFPGPRANRGCDTAKENCRP